MTIREAQERAERLNLSRFATLSEEAEREREEPRCDMRTEFCRDRDRIIHCKAFRRLSQKTQVFLSPEGDHYRTRLTHTLEVAQIARTVAKALGLNEDLTEAVSLGHDLGHTPFGHAGERALDELCEHGFKHYEQSVRVVQRLEREKHGLNLTTATLDGIVNHTRGTWASTPEGRAVRHADRIAFLNHDLEDALTARVLDKDEIPPEITEVLGDTKSRRITALITALVDGFDGDFHLGGDIAHAYELMYRFMYERIYLNTEGAAKAEEHKVFGIIESLFNHYMGKPDALPEFYLTIAFSESCERAVADYISGMSDRFAVRCYQNLFIPRSWSIL